MITKKEKTTANRTYIYLAVLCYFETIVAYRNLVLRNYIRDDWRQLVQQK